MKKGGPNSEKIGFGHRQVPVEDFDEFALDPANVTFAERVGDHSPMDVFESRVIGVLGGDDESAEEDAVKSPLLGLNGEIRFGSFDVDEGNEEVGDRNLSSFDNVRYELGELRVLAGAGDCTTARRGGGWDVKSHVDDLSSGLNYLFN